MGWGSFLLRRIFSLPVRPHFHKLEKGLSCPPPSPAVTSTRQEPSRVLFFHGGTTGAAASPTTATTAASGIIGRSHPSFPAANLSLVPLRRYPPSPQRRGPVAPRPRHLRQLFPRPWPSPTRRPRRPWRGNAAIPAPGAGGRSGCGAPGPACPASPLPTAPTPGERTALRGAARYRPHWPTRHASTT